MKLERTRNSKRNIVFGVINRCIGLFTPFLLRTLLIYFLGTEYLGLNSLFTSILQVLSLSELGFSTAIVYAMYKPIAEDDTEKICLLLSLYRKIYFVVGFFISTLGLALIPFLPKLISGSWPCDISLTAVYLIYLFNTVCSYFFFGYKRAVFSAYQRTDIDDNISSILHLILYPLQAVILVAFKNYYFFVVFTPIMTVVQNIVCAIVVNNKYPQLKAKGSVTREEAFSIINSVRYLCLHKFGNTLSNSFDSIIVSSVLGLNILAIYSNYYYVCGVVLALLTIVYTSFTAGIGNSLVTETTERNYLIFNRLTFMNAWIQCFCITCLMSLYQPFMKVWIGKENMFSFDTVVCFVIYFYIFTSRKIVLAFKDAAGLWKQDSIKPIIGGVFNLCVNILLAKIIGVNGVIISTICSYLMIELPWETTVLFKEVFRENVVSYYVRLLRYTLVDLLICILVYYINSFIRCQGIGELICKGIICMIVPNVILVFLYRNTNDYQYFKNMIIGFLKRVS